MKKKKKAMKKKINLFLCQILQTLMFTHNYRTFVNQLVERRLRIVVTNSDLSKNYNLPGYVNVTTRLRLSLFIYLVRIEKSSSCK